MENDGLIGAANSGNVANWLSEARGLIAGGEPARARATLEAGLTALGEQKDILSLLAWLCAETGDRGDAADTFVRLAALTPLEPEQQAFIGFERLGEGRADEAEPYLSAALQAQPDNPVYLGVWVQALIRLDRAHDALGTILSALRQSRPDPAIWPMAIDVAIAAGRYGLAELLARRAVRLSQGDHSPVCAAARRLLDRGAATKAARFLMAFPNVDHPELVFLQSVAFAQGERYPEAAALAERAVAMLPQNREYILHVGALLGRLGRHVDAARHVDIAGGYVPDEQDRVWLRGIFAIYTEAGRYDHAIEAGARLVQLIPEDLDFLSVYQTVIGKQLYAKLIGNRDGAHDALKKFPSSKNTAAHVSKIKPQSALRSIGALFRREMKTRFGHSRLGYLWVLFEPLAHIGIMIFLIGMLNHGGLPPIGQSFAIFYFTGIIPYHMFTHTVGHLIGSVPQNRPLLQIPRVRILDIFAARAVLEAVTELIVASILLTAFVIAGLDAMPVEPLGALAGLLILWIAAVGFGMMSAAVSAVFPAWERIWGALASIIYFTSGTFYIPRNMPVWLRDILIWNPVLQGIEFVRFNYFHEPAPEWLNIKYLAGFAIGSVAIGLIMERMMRRRMLDVE